MDIKTPFNYMVRSWLIS